MATSKIEWTESTWNPVTGCSKVSEGCRHCYAEVMARRLRAMGQSNYRNGFKVTLHPETLEKPIEWKKPQTVFVNSMSDLFHEDIPDSYILNVFDVMARAYWHRFQILTKRAERLAEMASKIAWKPNMWMGVTIESNANTQRIDCLRQVPAHIRFLSMEPLLESIPNLNLNGIHWVIVGGESGVGARPVLPTWVDDIREQCGREGIPFFFKQWGGVNKKKAGRLLGGRTWDEMPLPM